MVMLIVFCWEKMAMAHLKCKNGMWNLKKCLKTILEYKNTSNTKLQYTYLNELSKSHTWARSKAKKSQKMMN